MHTRPSLSRTSILAGIFLVAVALFLRIWVARDAFWLDEIWSYNLIKLINNPLQILTDLKIDNNHLLNTWFMYLIGEQSNWFTYRIPSILSGTATVVLMGMSAIRLGNKPWLAMLFGAISLPLVQYSAEARGYGLAAFLGIAAWYIFYFKAQPANSFRWVMLFWLVCALGFMAHLSFVFVFVSLGAAWGTELFCKRQMTQPLIVRGLTIFLPPGIFLIWLYVIFYSQLSVGGGQTTVLLTSSLLRLGQSLLGAPINSPGPLLACGITVVLCVTGLIRLERCQQYFFVAVLLLVPSLLLTVFDPEFFYPRYILTCVPFAYLLIAQALEPGLYKTGAIRLISAVLLLLILTGSSLQLYDLARWGKGNYPRAIEDMYISAGKQTFTVGSDFDFRHKALIDFYTRFRADAELLVYVKNAHTVTPPTDFFIKHAWQPKPRIKQYIRLENDSTYEIFGIYPYSGLSGWNWYIYRHTQKPIPK
jgi:4-amino-4-deoxy-L-arabinose transferase-like glycosyltransferase